MLTLQYILKVERMMEQTGGYPAGAYDVSHPNYNQTNGTHPPVISKNQVSKPGEKTVKVSLDYVVDKTTGDVRIVQK